MTISSVINIASRATQLTGPIGSSVTVRLGDSLSAIAQRHNISLQDLLDANPHKKAHPNWIYPGEVITLPSGSQRREQNTATHGIPSHTVINGLTSLDELIAKFSAQFGIDTGSPTVTIVPQTVPAPQTVTVAKGDTLSAIAKRFGVSTDALRRANDLDPADDRFLSVGKALRLPEGSPAHAPTPPSITAGLGVDVNKLIALSPSLKADLKILHEKRWEVIYGPEGGGSFADRDEEIIVLDGKYRENAEVTTQILAHEVGHATYDYTPDCSSREIYLKGTLADEGMATINNIRVQQEIREAGGRDIGIAGAYTSTERDFYNKTYHDLTSGKIDIETARDVIGETYRHKKTSGQTYENYYGGWYDRNVPRKGNPKCPS